MSQQLDYKAAGLDLDVYEDTIGRIGRLVKKTHGPGVLDGFGGFASLFSLDVNRWLFSGGYRKPVLVTCTDGVGTKLKIAALMGKFDTVGIDLVAMSVNDCLCTGAEPLVFLDYLAMPKDDPRADRAAGERDRRRLPSRPAARSTAAKRRSCPTSTQPGDYDMAGFCVGVVERDDVIDGKHIQVGDVVLGLASTRAALQRLQPGAQDRLRPCRAEGRRPRAGAGQDRRRRVADADADLRRGRCRTC